MDNKGFCEDITEGKFSFPIIHAIRAMPHDHRILSILKQRTNDVELKKYVIKYMEQTGSFEYTKLILEGLHKDIIEEVNKLGGNELLMKIVELLAQCKV